ncbi:hypothetical protein L873DRAFT_1672583 [Choiromyces venosus 120613-1]|uniref:Tc1-like transposase DDE domain-containing protein n=1 Tax=Choiromyces venosus 120613-1 TaxID=1336337 RepID=A0A3N4JWN8_9PEZI|nr:hypothetical protein L873DRAFT_1672583 [Choiromyces venosus 120613-1]
MTWLRKHGITLLEIPPYSPDLNPIQDIWSLIKDKLCKQYLELYLMKKVLRIWSKKKLWRPLLIVGCFLT